MKKRHFLRFKIIFIILCCFLIFLIFLFTVSTRRGVLRNKFAKDCIKIYENNEEEIFKIQKILLCSSANAINLTDNKNMQELNLYQYTDIAIYIDNGEELSKKNTIKEMYIDNINLEGISNNENKSLNYKNLLCFGLKQDIKELNKTDDIKFNIIRTNKEDDVANYDEPTFFTDCSNPICLEYLNYNIKTNYKIEENKSILFDGTILKEAGISLEEIESKAIFKITIINNLNEKYTCYLNINIPLKNIYKGTSIKTINTKKNQYIFFREC